MANLVKVNQKVVNERESVKVIQNRGGIASINAFPVFIAFLDEEEFPVQSLLCCATSNGALLRSEPLLDFFVE
jgi:hypothetical protein